MSAGSKLRARLAKGDKMVAMGTWDVLSAKIIERQGFDMAALQSFQWAAGWGLPDIGLATPSDLLNLTMRMAGEVEIPILVDLEEGYGSPGKAAYWTREFERAGAAAVHVDDKGPVHMCPWMPGSENKIKVSEAEYTAEVIRAMAKARKDDMVIVARCQVKSKNGVDATDEEIRRLNMYIEAGADVVFSPKTPTMANDMGKLTAAVKKLKAPVLLQSNPPGYIEAYVPKGANDGKSIADRTFDEIFGCGVSIINSPQLYTVAYQALADALAGIKKEGNLQPCRDKMLPFPQVLDLVGAKRFD
jgi:methylisocitrate lyase